MEWQLQTAKAKFSQLVQKAINEGPQTVTRHSRPVVVVVSAEEFELMRDAKSTSRSCWRPRRWKESISSGTRACRARSTGEVFG
jgi:prevent-host-death family protein